MTANLGSLDRLLRVLIGLLLFAAPLLNQPPIWSSAAFAFFVMGVGVVLVATGLFRFCPIYRLLGISTCKP